MIYTSHFVGRKSLDQSLNSSGLKSGKIWSLNSSSSTSSNAHDIFSPTAISPSIPENLSDSELEFFDHKLREEAKKAVEFEAHLVGLQIGLLKAEYTTRVEAARRVKIEVKEELSEIRDENAGLLHQVGFNEGKAEFLARENEVFSA